MTFFPVLPPVNENSGRESNPMSQPLYMYLSGSAFLHCFRNTNKQLFNVKSVFKFLNHRLNM